MTDADRALRAFMDVLTVEWDADAGVARIVTLSDCYYAFPDDGQHNCPDREYHDPEDGMCKHLVALETVRGTFDAPEGWLVVENLDERTGDPFDLEVPDRVGRNRTLSAFESDGGTPYRDEVRIDGVAPDGRPRVERVTVRETHSSTVATHRRLPPECAVLVDGDGTPLSALSPTERAWVRAETEADVPDPDVGSVSVRDRDTGEIIAAETAPEVESTVAARWEGGR